MNAAVIKHIQIAAAHDGIAELIVTLEFANGGQSLVTLDEYATRTLLQSAGTDDPEDLTGKGWELVRDALAASSARYQNEDNSDQRDTSHV
ncbi:MAG: hypothetical protein CME85_04515 [Henriciella sp.]|jgi:hypothetical protein|nr:hypothetical protein [Hyphomonadaceae bacterium]MBK74742.1 hypothetical protein [Henriciella sp.]PHR75113.1 MAG: hypothetical protein COA64_12740 [Henriciella sp.]|tara:strand:+ start:1129 stop:1401 length:273 start_codon:yes stop_codon:yes gene_type:complete